MKDRVEDGLFNRVQGRDIGKSISNLSNNNLDKINEVVLDLLINGGNNGVVRYTPHPFRAHTNFVKSYF